MERPYVLHMFTPGKQMSPFDVNMAADAGYQPVSAAPEAAALIPGLPARPYATALLLDQSGSILASDATGARLYSTKAFLSALGGDDRALLAAFASGPAALITSAPLTVYGAFRDRAAAPGYFSTLDGLAQQLGGATPLYDSLDNVRRQIVADPTVPADMARAVVVFTDGADTHCVSPADCRARREQSQALLEPLATAGMDGLDEQDDTLSLLFLCCHPDLPPPSQIALTLRAVGGLTTDEIARTLLVSPATLAQRIVRRDVPEGLKD